MSASRIALGYAVLAMLWIAFSDAVVTYLKLNPVVMTIKGALFVFVTASLLYFTIRRLVQTLQRASQERDETAKLYRTVVEASNEGICLLDESERISFLNGRLAAMLGRPVGELLGKPLQDFIEEPQALAERGVQQSATQEYRLRTDADRRPSVLISRQPVLTDGGEVVQFVATVIDITDRKRTEEELRLARNELLTHLRFFQSMDKINRAMQGTNELEQVMKDVLDAMLAIFAGDRAFLVYPCDPKAPLFEAVIERTRPEYKTLGVVPMNQDLAGCFQAIGSSAGTVTFGHEGDCDYPLKGEVLTLGLKSAIAIAIHPKTGKPWILGIHQCSHPRVWSREEKNVLEEIARRITDVLTSLLAHRELRESEQRHRLILQTAMDGFLRVDMEGRIIDVNDTYCRMSGYSERELLRMHAAEVSALRTAEMIAALNRKLAEEGPQRFESVHRRKDGSSFDVEVSAQYKPIAGGQAVIFVRDITERKRAEEALRESEMRFRAFLDQVADAICVVDEQHKIVEGNRQACEGMGYTREEVIGMTPKDFDPDTDAARLQWINDRVAAGEVCTFETRNRRKDGTLLPVEVRVRAVQIGGRQLHLASSRDITERKRAEDALRHSQAELAQERDRLSLLLEINNHIVSKLESKELFHAVAQSMRSHFGADLTSFLILNKETGNLERKFLDFPASRGFLEKAAVAVPSKLLIEWWRLGRPVVYSPLEADIPQTLREADRAESILSAVSVPLAGADGPFGLFNIASQKANAFSEADAELIWQIGTQISLVLDKALAYDQLRISRDGLQRSEAYLAEAQRLSHTGNWALNLASGEYDYWSEETFRIYELDPREGIPTNDEVYRQLLHPEDRDRVKRSIEKSIREKVDILEEFRVVLRSGATKHIQVIRHPVLNEAGDVIQLVGTWMDITERKRAEEALREGETRFRTFVDHAADAFFMLDVEQGTIIDVNRSACESLGYTREELIGTTPDAFQLDSERAQMESVAERAAAGETAVDTHWHRRKDGALFPVEVHTSAFQYRGRRLLLRVARDISDRLRAEGQRDRVRQLEAELAHINRVSMLGELAASIAHEIGQPLAGVVGNGGACLRWLAREVPNLEEAREAATRIVRDGKRAGEIIARIRAMTKKAATPKEKLALNDTIQDVLALVGDEAKRRKVLIRPQFAADLSPVAGDRVQLQQVVLNLVMNGIEAMSTVDGRARDLVVTTRNLEPDQVQVTVEDAGTGLDPTAMDKIFDPFYSTKPTGMGMGLSICRSILQAHGGRLWATAKDGPGTMFHFTLPRYREDESYA